MAAQTKQIQQTHPMSKVGLHFNSVWQSLELISDEGERRRAQKMLKLAWGQMAGLMDQALREIQNGDALIAAALAAATANSEQRAAAVREVDRLQKQLDEGEQVAYRAVIENIAFEIGNAMGISPDAGRLLFDTLIGDLDDFEDVHGISGEQIHAFRGAMVAMLKALTPGEYQGQVGGES